MSDVLSKIKAKRNRATVPAREDYLIKQNLTASESSGSVDTKEVSDRAFSREAGDSFGQRQALRNELEKYPEIVRHSAIRLEKDLDRRLTRFCKENGCTIETFLEAAFEEAEADTKLREKILNNARHRYASRKKAGKLRQLITQLEKAGLSHSPT